MNCTARHWGLLSGANEMDALMTSHSGNEWASVGDYHTAKAVAVKVRVRSHSIVRVARSARHATMQFV